MSSDDEKDKQRQDSAANEAETERDEDAQDEDAEASGADAAAAGAADGEEGDESVAQAPRNRAERRQLAKQVKRGQATEDGEVKERDRNKAVVRPKVPPRTVTGKSTANTDEVPPWVKNLGEWMSARRTTVFAAVAAVVLGGAGIAYGLQKRADSRGEQAFKVVEAAEIFVAEVRGPDATPDPANMPPRRIRPYGDHTARARAALAAAEQASQGSADLATVPIARLQRGIALYDLGRYAEAKSALESAVGNDLAGLEARALETLGFCLEALNDLPGALRRFEELARVEGEYWRDLGAYHQARVLRRQSQNDRAKDMLHRLIERADRSRPDETSASTSRAVVEQARALLHEIAPEDPLGRTDSMPADQGELLRRLQQQFGNQLQIRTPGQGGRQ